MKLAWRTLTSLASVLTILATVQPGRAQALKDIRESSSPLVLKSRGSFMVGGRSLTETPAELSSPFGTPPKDGGEITVNQMYVEYMVPNKVTGVPVVMLHGATLTGKSYDTTPDGRMGWYEYFVRKGHPVYVPDQVGRGRSGVDLAVYNDVRAGVKAATALPNVFRLSDRSGWQIFRFGPIFGTTYPDEQFPIEAVGRLSQQAVPDLNPLLTDPDLSAKGMAEIARNLRGAVLMGHSEGGLAPLQAALLNPEGIKGVILIEPGGCGTSQLSDAQLKSISAIPMLVVFGDHLDNSTGAGTFSWRNSYNDCKLLVTRMQASGGNATMLYPPEIGIHGNSHMIMQDRNSLQIADLILKWLTQNVK